jgi:hypothetical protein
MPMTETHAATIRQELHGRISAIAAQSGRLSTYELVEEVDALRSIANAHGFTAVSTLAGRLESSLARHSSPSTLLCFLDALDDAVTLEPMRQQAQQALLASVALRLGYP